MHRKISYLRCCQNRTTRHEKNNYRTTLLPFGHSVHLLAGRGRRTIGRTLHKRHTQPDRTVGQHPKERRHGRGRTPKSDHRQHPGSRATCIAGRCRRHRARHALFHPVQRQGGSNGDEHHGLRRMHIRQPRIRQRGGSPRRNGTAIQRRLCIGKLRFQPHAACRIGETVCIEKLRKAESRHIRTDSRSRRTDRLRPL